MATARPQSRHGSSASTRERPRQPICAGSRSGTARRRRSQVRRAGKRPPSVSSARRRRISGVGSSNTASRVCTCARWRTIMITRALRNSRSGYTAGRPRRRGGGGRGCTPRAAPRRPGPSPRPPARGWLPSGCLPVGVSQPDSTRPSRPSSGGRDAFMTRPHLGRRSPTRRRGNTPAPGEAPIRLPPACRRAPAVATRSRDGAGFHLRDRLGRAFPLQQEPLEQTANVAHRRLVQRRGGGSTAAAAAAAAFHWSKYACALGSSGMTASLPRNAETIPVPDARPRRRPSLGGTARGPASIDRRTVAWAKVWMAALKAA